MMRIERRRMKMERNGRRRLRRSVQAVNNDDRRRVDYNHIENQEKETEEERRGRRRKKRNAARGTSGCLREDGEMELKRSMKAQAVQRDVRVEVHYANEYGLRQEAAAGNRRASHVRSSSSGGGGGGGGTMTTYSGVPSLYYIESDRHALGGMQPNSPENVRSSYLLTDISGERLRKRESLSLPQDFQWVMRRGLKSTVRNGLVTVFGIENETRMGATCTRIGLVVSKKVHKSAVKRNRVKRWLRDIFRRNKERFPARADIVLLALPGIAESTYHIVRAEILQILETRNVAGKLRPVGMKKAKTGNRRWQSRPNQPPPQQQQQQTRRHGNFSRDGGTSQRQSQ